MSGGDTTPAKDRAQPGPRKQLVLLFGCLALVASSCAIRVSHSAVVAAAHGQGVASSANAGDTTAVGPGATGGSDSGAGGVSSSGASSAAGSTGVSSGGGPSNVRSSDAGAAGSTASGPKSVVKIGSVGSLSGPAGAVLADDVNGLQGWVRSVNERGGLNGHPVQLIVADDGGDSAQHRALVQKLAETDHVLAFVNNTEALTGQGTVDYINSKRIPVIGTDTGGQWAYQSPMYFPQASSGDALLTVAVGGPAIQAVAKGKHKAGVISCTEAQICRDLYNRFTDLAGQFGMQSVYRAEASLAQPDFTAECLAAKSAGAELLLMSMDSSSVGRIASSCARQDYHPIYGFGASIVIDSLKTDPNLAGTVADSNVFPWFDTNTPAAAEFQAALKRYGLHPGVGAATGWTSGKLLEKAAAHLPEPPTTDAILQGLWSIKNDDLGGLTLPLTFIQNQPAPERACWYNVTIQGGQWMSPDNYTLICH